LRGIDGYFEYVARGDFEGGIVKRCFDEEKSEEDEARVFVGSRHSPCPYCGLCKSKDNWKTSLKGSMYLYSRHLKGLKMTKGGHGLKRQWLSNTWS